MDPEEILGMIDDGILDARDVAKEALKLLSSFDIMEMAEKNDWHSGLYNGDDVYEGIEGIDF